MTAGAINPKTDMGQNTSGATNGLKLAKSNNRIKK